MGYRSRKIRSVGLIQARRVLIRFLHHVGKFGFLRCCQSCGRSHVLSGKFRVSTNDEPVQASNSQEGRTGGPVQKLHGSIFSKSQAQTGNKNQIESLPAQSIQESKILSQSQVDHRHGGPPHELVGEKQKSEQDHLESQEGFTEITDTRGLDLNDRENSQSSHHCRQAKS